MLRRTTGNCRRDHGVNQPVEEEVADYDQVDNLKLSRLNFEWGIDLGAENYEEPLTLNLGSKSKTSKSKSGTNAVNMNAFLHERKAGNLLL